VETSRHPDDRHVERTSESRGDRIVKIAPLAFGAGGQAFHFELGLERQGPRRVRARCAVVEDARLWDILADERAQPIEKFGQPRTRIPPDGGVIRNVDACFAHPRLAPGRVVRKHANDVEPEAINVVLLAELANLVADVVTVA
jgi:hypothetical protein